MCVADDTVPHHRPAGQTAARGQTSLFCCFDHSSSLKTHVSLVDCPPLCPIRCRLWTACWRSETSTSGPSASALWYVCQTFLLYVVCILSGPVRVSYVSLFNHLRLRPLHRDIQSFSAQNASDSPGLRWMNLDEHNEMIVLRISIILSQTEIILQEQEEHRHCVCLFVCFRVFVSG